MSNPWHPDESQLLAYADAELAADAEAVRRHIESCAECLRHVDELRGVLTAAGTAWKAPLPPPPQPWADLRPRLNKLDAGRVRSRSPLFPRVDYRWVAAAAAFVIGVVALRLASEQTVSAAELLQKATVQEAQAPKPKRIRVRTRRSQWVRPAAAPSGAVEEAEVVRMFENANYNWDEPLSVKTFSAWRSSLSEKDDRVRILQQTEFGSGRFYEITTTTPRGELAQASITLRGADLRPVRERFEFRNDEFVEVAEDIEASAPVPQQQVAQAPRTPADTQREPVTPGHELQVFSALHAIGADLGEPLEVTRGEGSIVVSAIITDAERQHQIRAALSGLRLVDLRFETPDDARQPASAPRLQASEPPDSENPLHERLASRLGGRVPLENFTNHVLDLSDAALARAHALRTLAQRFPETVESQFTAREREMLASMQADHAKRLVVSVRSLSNALRPLASPQPAQPAPDAASWQALASDLLESAQRMDRAATETLAGRPAAVSADEALSNLARSAQNLQAHAEALQSTLARSGGR